nr:uncharacterized protein LOC111416169 [Onthophagus taurus]
MSFKVIVLFGILALISDSIAKPLTQGAKTQEIDIFKTAGSSKDTVIDGHTMDDEMIANVLSAVEVALATYDFTLERVRYIKTTLTELYPNLSFNVIEQFSSYSIHGTHIATLRGYDFTGAYTWFLIYA